MIPSIKIRPYQQKDLQALVELWHDAKQKAYTFSHYQLSITRQDDLSYFRNTLVKQHNVWVAELDDEWIAGFFALKGNCIDQIMVHVDWQRKKIGSRMMNKAKELNPETLLLEAHLQNHCARLFYIQQGFIAGDVTISPSPESLPVLEYKWVPE